MFAKHILLLISLFSCAYALSSPHIARGVHHRRAVQVVGRTPSPVLAEAPVLPVVRRSLTKRCKPRNNSTQPTVPPSTLATTQVPPPSSTHSTTSPPPPATTQAQSPPQQEQELPQGNLPSYLIGTQTGDGTYYSTGLGACGITNTDSDHIAAVSHLLFDTFPGYTGQNPNNNPICNRQVVATYQGKQTTVTITDRCQGCNITDLDFSPAAFADLAPFAVGRIRGMEWTWVS